MTPTIISFVSGKGGVGKTSLAANFAWISSQFVKTALIDLDFQNQGCTGLLLSKVDPETCGIFEGLQASPVVVHPPARLSESLYFVPSVSARSPANYTRIANSLQDAGLLPRLSEYIEVLASRDGFSVVILDCHGGLDYASAAARQLSRHTVVVTEADVVSFNGTLELLAFYNLDRGTERESQLSADCRTRDCGRREVGDISFVVNRLPPKYRFADISAAYSRILANYKGPMDVQQSFISFIPEESYFAESFGEYPFCIELAPQSVFSRKLQLLAIDLLPVPEQELHRYRPMKKFAKSRFRNKIQTTILSAESKNMNNIVFAFGWMMTVFSLGLIATLGFELIDLTGASPPSFLRFSLRRFQI